MYKTLETGTLAGGDWTVQIRSWWLFRVLLKSGLRNKVSLDIAGGENMCTPTLSLYTHLFKCTHVITLNSTGVGLLWVGSLE